MEANLILGFAGRKNSGKDLAATILVEEFGFKKLSFADPLKKMLKDVFSLTDEQFNDRVIKESNFSVPILITDKHLEKMINYFEMEYSENEKARFFETGLNKTIKSPRQLMQFVGTDLFRALDLDWCTAVMEHDICCNYEPNDNLVISDVRFHNEARCLEALKGHCIYINRDMNNKDNHYSENALEPGLFKYTINNDGDREQLTQDIKDVFDLIVYRERYK